MTGTPTRRTVLASFVAASAATVFAVRNAIAAQPREHLAEITSFKFKPARLQVNHGDTVTWLNRDIAPHTATAEDESWSTGQIGKGEQKSVIIRQGMEQRYFCRFHPVMKAEVLIAAG